MAMGGVSVRASRPQGIAWNKSLGLKRERRVRVVYRFYVTSYTFKELDLKGPCGNLIKFYF